MGKISGFKMINFKCAILTISVLLAGKFEYLLGFPSDNLSNGETFDFIVVGGGTAGCAVAARLAENGQHSVLLIEGGGIPDSTSEIPALSPQLSINPETVTIYPSVPQRNAALSQNGIFNFTRGNLLGGSSSINGMMFNRGSPHDFNNWAKLTGDPSWNYENLLKYFKKSEDYDEDFPSDQRGFGGPISVSRPRFAPGRAEWLQGGAELGFPIAEPNSPQMISFTPLDFSRKRGRRVSSFKGYIDPLLQPSSSSLLPFNLNSRANLRILIHTTVTRIVFDGNRAVGVKFIANSTSVGYATARKEVILSGGAVETPALLMRSGVGPKSVLDAAHIPVVKYLPVGRNLHDHPTSPFTIVLGNRSLAIDEQTDLNSESWRLYNEIGDGPYAVYQGQSGQALLASSLQSPYERSLGWPDIQIMMTHSNSASGVLGGGVQVNDLKSSETAVRWVTALGRPKSRGTVTLNPWNIDGPPRVDFQFLADPHDVKLLVEGMKMSVKLCEETKAFRRVGCRVPTDRVPACAHLPFRSDLYWNCYARQLTGFAYHAVGTCKMGRFQDPEAVVDTKLKVIGINNLRVVDASVIPVVSNTNTMSPVYAVAEKAADMIKQDWEQNFVGIPALWSSLNLSPLSGISTISKTNYFL